MITIAHAEWKFPMPYWLEPYRARVVLGASCMALHMDDLVCSIWLFLASPWGQRWFVVLERVNRTEYQGRDTQSTTLHWHIAAWELCRGLLRLLAGRTGSAMVSGFVRFLSLIHI